MSTNRKHPLQEILEHRIAIIDGAMGTTIRTYGMKEADIRGRTLQGLEEGSAQQRRPVLSDPTEDDLRHPSPVSRGGSRYHRDEHVRRHEHRLSEFFVDDPREHGGRKDPAFYQKVIEDPFLNDLAWEINEQSARQCREWADRVANATSRPRFVAGAIGPLTVSLSNSPDADDSGFRVVTFDQVKAAYIQQVRALIAGGSDLLLVETIFDSLNAKAALVAIREVFDQDGKELPVMISAAVGRGGETMISPRRRALRRFGTR